MNVIAVYTGTSGKGVIMKRVEGYAIPLGIHVENKSVNFAIEVKSGATCSLNLYRSGSALPEVTYDIEENHYISGIRFLRILDFDMELTEYDYVINGEAFVDPYALEVTGRRIWGNEPKTEVRGKILSLGYEDEPVTIPRIPNHEVIAYRLHVRGLTIHPSSKVKSKGTFEGVVEKIPYFKELGVNQLQLLPSYEFIEEGTKINYWGYTKGYYMAPKSSYCMNEKASESLKQMVNVLHANGIEVILDMPFVDGPSLMYQITCLRYYVTNYRIDGFVLNPYITNLSEVKGDPILQQVKIINQCDEYQIAMRKFLKGDEGMIREIAWNLKKPVNHNNELTYNYITSNNGFTLLDLVSYDGKHNESNGERNQDGNNYNYCWNCGVEGVTRKKVVMDLRKKQLRNAWTLLMLSQGAPCILAGDEFGNTQQGNNNAYCQDNEISWIDWRQKTRKKELYQFVVSLIQLRKKYPVLHQQDILQGMDTQACGIPDVSYHGSQAWIMPEAVASRQLGVLYSGSKVKDVDCYIAYNMHWEPHEFAIPSMGKKKWYQVLDTNLGMITEPVLIKDQRKVHVVERSISMFICK